MTKLTDQFHAARKVSVPLIVIRTADPAATMENLKAAAVVENQSAPLLKWDIAQGVKPLNEEGKDAVAKMVGEGELDDLQDPSAALKAALRMPPQSVLFFLNAQRFVTGEPSGAVVAQAIWNLRDQLKGSRRTWVGLCPDIQLPPELQQDVLVLDEPLPNPEQLKEIIEAQYKAAGLPSPNGEVMPKAVEAVRGLAAYPVEQETAMCLSKSGLDLEALWERKRRMVETGGLNIWRGGESFKDVRGVRNILGFLGQLVVKRAFTTVVFLDELEKMVGGGIDSHETTKAQQETFLAWTQNVRALGIILTGVAGSGKSLTAKAAGGEAGVPVVMLSLSALRGSLVGETEQRTKAAFKTVDAVAQGRILLLATCNRMAALTPEIRSRFRLGTFFYDFPDGEELAALWQMYRDRFKIKKGDPLPDCQGWVGREVESCCEIASLLNVPLKEAATYIVPVARSASAEIEQGRAYASGRFISASHPGIYRHDSQAAIIAAAPQRRVSLE